MKRKLLKEFGVFLAVVGLAGAVFFFPMKLGDGKTCLAEQYIGSKMEVHAHGLHHGHEMAQAYIIPYGIIWWVSLAMFAAGLYLTRGRKNLIDESIDGFGNQPKNQLVST